MSAANINKDDRICIVLVCNANFINKFYNIVSQIRTIGQYNGDITLIIGIDMNKFELQKTEFMVQNKINIIQLPNIEFPEYVNLEKLKITNNDGRHMDNRIFQWHKMYIFNTYFKKWDYILYIDCGMRIYQSIAPILELRKSNRLLAHQDAFPGYNWTLGNQFENNHNTFAILQEKYDMLDKHYFQTGIMLFDTDIIKNDTFEKLYNLSVEFPMSRTNEQGIMNLYFISNNVYEPLPISNEQNYYYDFCRRFSDKGYIITARDF
jgi:hypothetical protein